MPSPDKGDIVWLDFDPQAGHEQSGKRPALVLSPVLYNQRSGLAIVCPITSKVKSYPYTVIIPDNLEVQGAILSDQVKSIDWKARKTKFICKPKEKGELLRTDTKGADGHIQASVWQDVHSGFILRNAYFDSNGTCIFYRGYSRVTLDPKGTFDPAKAQFR